MCSPFVLARTLAAVAVAVATAALVILMSFAFVPPSPFQANYRLARRQQFGRPWGCYSAELPKGERPPRDCRTWVQAVCLNRSACGNHVVHVLASPAKPQTFFKNCFFMFRCQNFPPYRTPSNAHRRNRRNHQTPPSEPPKPSKPSKWSVGRLRRLSFRLCFPRCCEAQTSP